MNNENYLLALIELDGNLRARQQSHCPYHLVTVQLHLELDFKRKEALTDVELSFHAADRDFPSYRVVFREFAFVHGSLACFLGTDYFPYHLIFLLYYIKEVLRPPGNRVALAPAGSPSDRQKLIPLARETSGEK
jgi:hypothetical protein